MKRVFNKDNFKVKRYNKKEKGKYIDIIKIPINDENKDRLKKLASIQGEAGPSSSFYTIINGVNKYSKGYLVIEISSYCELAKIREYGVKKVKEILFGSIKDEKSI